jgi:Zn-dependent protease with chaperone function
MRRKLSVALVLTLVLSVGGAAAEKKLKQLKPGFNFFSKDQDVQLGKESAAQVEQQMTVVKNPQLDAYVQKIATKLWSQPEAGDFPYTIKVVYEPSINAFALPGGPMFIHTGLIASAENDAQIAGVLAHEISHVALRHGTHQASKSQMIQLPAMLAGAVAGGSMLGQLAQMGIGLGANSVLLKYSRDAESQADYLGTELMAKAGYNPQELAKFFDKLEQQAGGDPGKTAQFFSDHPNPGNRVKAIEEEIQLLPQQNYTNGDAAELKRMQAVVQSLPVPPKKPGVRGQQQGQTSQGGGGGGVKAADIMPSKNLRAYSGSYLSMQHPDNWEVFAGQNSSEVTIAPRAGIAQSQNGQAAIAAGMIVNIVQAQYGDLQKDTQALIRQIAQNNQGVRVGNTSQTQWNGAPALLTQLQSPSPIQGETELDTVLTAQRPQGLLFVVMISPQSMANDMKPAFETMLRSVKMK